MKMKNKLIGILCAVVLVVFIAANMSSNVDAVRVSGGVTSEAQIIGNMIVELITHETDYNATFLNNLASANINQVAMERGQLDISSVRYTGTDLMGTLSLPVEKDPDKALEIVQQAFQERYHQNWFPSYGFNNQFTFMVNKETAEKYNLKKVSDLAQYSNEMVLGCDQTWYKRPGDGYEGFTEEYNMTFKQVFPMQVGLLYDAVQSGDLDVILGYSTDGRVGSYELVMLEDDLKFFPPYTCSMVVSDEALQKYPDLEPVLKRLENTITTEQMQKLNFESDDQLVEPQLVARNFLEKNNYFREGE